MIDGTCQLLILGLGNLLCMDDGVGVVAVARLRRRYRPPDGVRVLDGGTLGLSLLPVLRAARDVILVDAIAAPAPAGSLVRLEGSQVAPAVEQRLSPHQVGVADLLDGARLLDGEDQRIVLLGLVPRDIDLGTDLTEPVGAGVDELVEAVIDQAASWGLPFSKRRDDADTSPSLAADDVARVLEL